MEQQKAPRQDQFALVAQQVDANKGIEQLILQRRPPTEAEIAKARTFLEQNYWTRIWQNARSATGSFAPLIPKSWKEKPGFFPACYTLTGTKNNFALFCVMANKLMEIRAPTGAEILAIQEAGKFTKASKITRSKTKWTVRDAEKLIGSELRPLIVTARRTGDWYPLKPVQLGQNLNIQRICRALYGSKGAASKLLQDERSGIARAELRLINNAVPPIRDEYYEELRLRIEAGVQRAIRTGDLRFITAKELLPETRHGHLLTAAGGFDSFLKAHGVPEALIESKSAFTQYARAFAPIAKKTHSQIQIALAAGGPDAAKDPGLLALKVLADHDPIWVSKVLGPRLGIHSQDTFRALIERLGTLDLHDPERILLQKKILSEAALHFTETAQNIVALIMGPYDGNFPYLIYQPEGMSPAHLASAWLGYADAFAAQCKQHAASKNLETLLPVVTAIAEELLPLTAGQASHARHAIGAPPPPDASITITRFRKQALARKDFFQDTFGLLGEVMEKAAFIRWRGTLKLLDSIASHDKLPVHDNLSRALSCKAAEIGEKIPELFIQDPDRTSGLLLGAGINCIYEAIDDAYTQLGKRSALPKNLSKALQEIGAKRTLTELYCVVSVLLEQTARQTGLCKELHATIRNLLEEHAPHMAKLHTILSSASPRNDGLFDGSLLAFEYYEDPPTQVAEKNRSLALLIRSFLILHDISKDAHSPFYLEIGSYLGRRPGMISLLNLAVHIGVTGFIVQDKAQGKAAALEGITQDKNIQSMILVGQTLERSLLPLGNLFPDIRASILTRKDWLSERRKKSPTSNGDVFDTIKD